MASSNQRGFAAMDPHEQRRVASKGGKAAHESGHAHEWNSEEAAEAGRRGGSASLGERAAFHHETAAHHHNQAAHFRSAGQHVRADMHAENARAHARRADEYGEAASRSGRGFASMEPERQAEAGRHGADARWSRGESSEVFESDDDGESQPSAHRRSSTEGQERESHQ